MLIRRDEQETIAMVSRGASSFLHTGVVVAVSLPVSPHDEMRDVQLQAYMVISCL